MFVLDRDNDSTVLARQERKEGSQSPQQHQRHKWMEGVASFVPTRPKAENWKFGIHFKKKEIRKKEFHNFQLLSIGYWRPNLETLTNLILAIVYY